MEEFIFGTLATDELKLFHHRVEQRGIHHRHRLNPRDPLPGQAVMISVTVGPDLSADQVCCYYTLDGSPPAGAYGVPSNGFVLLMQPSEVAWDTPLWGYTATYQAVIPSQPDGTRVRYRIGAWGEGGAETFADWPEIKETTERAALAFFQRRPLDGLDVGDPQWGELFSYPVDTLTAPAWAREAVIYNIFVDRFYPGDRQQWIQTSDVGAFSGGTLWGVLDKLDYLIDLGVTCLWLSPIFPSPTSHGYDATDLMTVDPKRGGDPALRTLISEAHGRGLRIVLDLVCNHISSDHPIFLDARSNPNSPYRDWFLWDDEGRYRMFFGVDSMPQINVADDGARRWLLEVGQYWLDEYDVDGYRLDHAQGPGPDFWADFRAACRDAKPDSFSFGEVVETPEVVEQYIGRLDGCLDFFISDALRMTYGRGAWSEADFARFLRRHELFFPSDFVLPTFLDNHDMDRFLFIARGDKAKLKQAAAVQMSLPHPPVIYYGTEVGLSQDESTRGSLGLQASRKVMAWGDDQDQELLAFYKAIIAERKGRDSQGLHRLAERKME